MGRAPDPTEPPGLAFCWAGAAKEPRLAGLRGALRFARLEQPSEGTLHQRAGAAAPRPRRPPALTPTRGRQSPRHRWSPSQHAGAPAAPHAPFPAPSKEGRAGAPEASPARPPPPLPQPAHPTRAARRRCARIREGSAARCPRRPQSCSPKWRCASGRRGRAARETPRQPAPCACGRCPSWWSPACCSW